MIEPLFWLGLSLLLVAMSLTAVLVVAIPALQELARAARSAEKLCDTLCRELPPTLEAIRLTGIEISDLTDDLSDGVQGAGNVVRQVDQGVSSVKNQARAVNFTTRSVLTGFRAAWQTWTQPNHNHRSSRKAYPASQSQREVDFRATYWEDTSVYQSTTNAVPQSERSQDLADHYDMDFEDELDS